MPGNPASRSRRLRRPGSIPLLLLVAAFAVAGCSDREADSGNRDDRAEARPGPEPPGSSPRPGGADRDCGSFSNQAEAQRALAGGDPHGLDGDGDGIACTSLPCPCSKAAAEEGNGDPERADGEPSSGSSFRARVVSVTDGDTIKVEAAGIGIETIRLIGIDTPEVYGGVECGGREASDEMKRLATGMVTVRTDPSQDLRDRYDRLLAYIDKGGRDLGRAMVARGLAPTYVYETVFRRYPAYSAAENRARAARRGSWKPCDFGD
ncbi:MAG: thermonuclease family protein [Acidobacteriota bacterium]